MTDRISLELKDAPWAPVGSSIQKIYFEFDAPLSGIMEQGGTQFLFVCLNGQVDQYSLWAYTRVEPREIRKLDAVDQSQFYELVEKILNDRPVVATIAVDDETIFMFTLEEGGNHRSIQLFVKEQLEELVRQAHEVETQIDRRLAAAQ